MVDVLEKMLSYQKRELLFDNYVSASFGCSALDRISKWQRDRR